MPKIKVGTFNTENLFLRYQFKGSKKGKPINYNEFKKSGGTINTFKRYLADYEQITHIARKMTAQVITENNPDVIAVQEVENLEALLQFNSNYLKTIKYPYALVIDGNDPRGIDVGILSRFDFANIRTHRFEIIKNDHGEKIFSRDCLEVELKIPDTKNLTFLINHLKSKIGGGEERRRIQAERITEILKERFGEPLEGNFIVAGDFNSHYTAPELQALLSLPGLENVVKRLPNAEQWTYYYKKSAEQFDYLLLSPALSQNNLGTLPYIERRGLSSDIKFYQGKRFTPQINSGDEASDHCAVFMEVEV